MSQLELKKVLGDIDKASGKFDEVINYSTEDRIIALQKAGYELVNDGFTTEDGRVYDADDTKNNFKVTVKQRVEPVTPMMRNLFQVNQLIQKIQIHQYGQILQKILS